MGWLLLIGLGIVWAAFLFPQKRSRTSTFAIEEFNRDMSRLADTERSTGRWIVAPRKDVRFMGGEERARCRTIARRRRFFVVLLEALGLTFLIGLFPPLRGMWFATAIIAALLAMYVWMLVQAKQEEGGQATQARGASPFDEAAPQPVAVPVLEPVREPSWAGPSPYGAYGQLAADDLVHVVVYRSGELQTVDA
jgi:hypothetical protein